ncbi:unnamed protein product [Paramecium octaurelia]|uniref:MORN motif protein n=1 Tax=Paramecium octaurelia TaxID=43137 RepID=A0A8S1TAP4_PAROT|nr:unnamed protein product [Paramecium octaurelia]
MQTSQFISRLQEYQLIQNVQLQVQRIQKKYPLISNIEQFQKDLTGLFSIQSQESLKKQLLALLNQYKVPIPSLEFNQLTRKENQIIIISNNAEIKLAMNGRFIYNHHENNTSYQIFPNKCIYHGQVHNKKPNGEGSFKWDNGEYYIGQWSNAQKHGFGQWKGTQDDYYIGQWVNGQQDGLGEHKWNGDVYFGQWKNSVKNGYGVEQFQNGDKYIGNYYFGKPQGQGEYRWVDGSIYQGQFLEGMRHGYGRYINKNGIIYEGEYQNDVKHGIGKITHIDGSHYQGSHANDGRNDQGIPEYSNNHIDGSNQKQNKFLSHNSNSQEKPKQDLTQRENRSNSSSQNYQSNLYSTYLNTYQNANLSFQNNKLRQLQLPDFQKQKSKDASQSKRTYSMNQKRISQRLQIQQNYKSASIDLEDIYNGDAYRTIKKKQTSFRNNNNLYLINNNKKSIKNVFVY